MQDFQGTNEGKRGVKSAVDSPSSTDCFYILFHRIPGTRSKYMSPNSTGTRNKYMSPEFYQYMSPQFGTRFTVLRFKVQEKIQSSRKTSWKLRRRLKPGTCQDSSFCPSKKRTVLISWSALLLLPIAEAGRF